ncbi:DUF305 domain-containing protein [Agrococcus sp. SGAir0287]|uniref:DUF305 domain-containing protein n=1 Tax=Agrococcus sp. SGAir0287 TaxID=2070347 RepID=UPI0010CCDB9A|nr:DUF305 domain-containing protein [Agrococcus sp. SGAir0287]QCR19153.1 DUF305 domain-containing protein [Agrococcus sp. SGAir0287]
MTRRLVSIAAGLAVAGLALAGCASSDAGSGHDGHASPTATTHASSADVMFASMMIPHHEQAVEMADIVLAKPDLDPRVAELASRIRDAQAPEIATMQAWLEAWGADADAHEGMDHGDDGMLGDDEIAALEAADGATASRLFLEGMIAHHEGAIAMAEQQLADGSDPDALALAALIVETQQAEVDEMRELLAAL